MQSVHGLDDDGAWRPALQVWQLGDSSSLLVWNFPAGQRVQENVSVILPTKQLRLPDPWYPALQDGLHDVPDVMTGDDGQFPRPPLVGEV